LAVLLAVAAVVLIVKGLPLGISMQAGTRSSFSSSPSTFSGPRTSASAASVPELRAKRVSPLDLEIGGDLAGVPQGSTRYLTRDDLLAFPQVRARVTNDSNFGAPVKVSGVSLEQLLSRLSAAPKSDMVIAICEDKYHAHYSPTYLALHRPLLVLEVNGKPPEGWPKDPEGSRMGPYMISHPDFKPAFTILAHAEEPQIPWGVLRLEFRNENEVIGAIAPQGPHRNEPAVQAGFRIAQQNCFHCHNRGEEGGGKAGVPWAVLSKFASQTPEFFATYVRDPKAKNPRTQMSSNPGFDDATMGALIAYFQTFSERSKP
jgi:mono/diheme cytochrome c family protein